MNTQQTPVKKSVYRSGRAAAPKRGQPQGGPGAPRRRKLTDAELRRRPGGEQILRRRWKRRRRAALVVTLPALVVVLAVVLVLKFAQAAGSYTVEGTAYRYYAGQATRVAEGSVLSRTGEGETIMLSGGSQSELTSIPVYFEDRQAILLPQPMIYYAADGANGVRVECFSEIRYADHGGASVVSGGKEIPLSGGFLYDGTDTYLFIEPVTLYFNGYKLELGQLSYLVADYQNSMMVYNRGDGAMMLEPITGGARVETVNGRYTVELIEDSMTMGDGTRRLLFTRPELLDSIG